MKNMRYQHIFVIFALAVSAVFLLPKKSFADSVSCSGNLDGKSDAELQQILDACDREIAAQQAIVDQNQEQQATLNQDISALSANITKSTAVINAQAAQIKQLGSNITQKQQYINQLNDRMDTIKQSIAQIIRQSSALQDSSIIEVFLSSESLSNFFKNSDNYSTINGKLHDLTNELMGVASTTQSEKQSLEDKKAQVQKLQYEQQQTKNTLVALQKEKQQVLAAAKKSESAAKALIASKESLKNQIRNRLFKTVGGVELTFGQALQLIQPYESTIGVNSALTLAVLTQETSVDGLIGKNIGKCYYNQSAKNSAGTVMSPSQVPSFLSIMNELGLNANTTPVSCPIYSDGAYGGAIGPAQFMPNTWWNVGTQSGYKSRVAAVLDTTIASPFENKDSFVGTALYLKDAQNICRTAFTKQWDIWACAAAKYYGGLALKGTTLTNYMYKSYGYGYQVAQRATQFAQDIQTLSL
jgi:peptidoglycan hydrolase CwlO-like protein